jgi:hypothetical protein
MALVDAIVREYVRRYDSKAAEDVYYITSVQATSGLNLRNLSEEDIERIVQPFLYKWGRMGRVLGQSTFTNWKVKLAEAVSRNASLLQRYATADLADVDLSPEKPHIERLYGSFRGATSQVAATKCLHLFCPGFFPMWDTMVAWTARKERREKRRDIVAAQEFSPEDYCQFIEQVQNFIISHSVLLSQIAEEYGKTRVKIVDEVVWWATQRPLCLIL